MGPDSQLLDLACPYGEQGETEQSREHGAPNQRVCKRRSIELAGRINWSRWWEDGVSAGGCSSPGAVVGEKYSGTAGHDQQP